MIGMDSYLNGYVDRRMQSIVEEWDLPTGNDLAVFSGRLAAIEEEVRQLKAAGQAASGRLAGLEARARALRGRT